MKKSKNISSISDLNATPYSQLLSAFDASADSVPEEYLDLEQFWFDELAHLIAGHGERGIKALFSRMPTADEHHLAAILTHMPAAKSKRRRFHDLVAKHVHDNRPIVAQAAIEAANQLGYKDLLPDVLTQIYSRSPFVVGAVLRYLGAKSPKIGRPIIMSALKSHDPIILKNAIDELDSLRCVESLPGIRALRNHDAPNVREAAEAAVHGLEALLSEDNGDKTKAV